MVVNTFLYNMTGVLFVNGLSGLIDVHWAGNERKQEIGEVTVGFGIQNQLIQTINRSINQAWMYSYEE